MRLRRAASRAFDPLGFTLYEAMLLLLVSRGMERPTDLIEMLDIQRTAVSALLTKFDRAGLVERKVDESDGRSVRVQLTPKGRKAAQDVSEAWAAQNAEGE